MSGAESDGEKAETGPEAVEVVESVEETLESSEEASDIGSELQSSFESAYDPVDYAGSFICVGEPGQDLSAGNVASVRRIDPWEDGQDPLKPPTDSLNSVTYIIDGAIGSTLASEDWVTERLPSDSIRRKGYEDSLDLAIDIAGDWADSLAEIDELTGVVISNSVHNGEGEPPVKFDYGNRHNGGVDTVAYEVFGEIIDVLGAEHGWQVEYVDRTEDGLEAYLAP